jgi:tetratricopeptide (TPR) repeat protein
MEEGRSGDAEPWLEKSVELDSVNSSYWLWLGRSYGDQTRKASIFRRRGLALRTRAAFEKAVALDSANLDARAHLVDYHLEAPGIVGGSEEEALRQAEEIRRRDEPRGLLELARVYESTKRPAQADSLLAAYGQGPPTTDAKALSEAEWVRGRILERKGDRVRARASYQAALELDPRNVAAAKSLRSLR